MDNPVNAKAALLQALISGEGFGLELIDRVAERTNNVVKLNQGSVYPALRSLEKEGLVESYDVKGPPERGGRPRRYYSLTAEGLRLAKGHQQAVSGLFNAMTWETA